MVEIARKLITGRRVVPLAGTPVPLVDEKIEVFMVLISCDLGNVNPVVIGDANIVATPGSQRGAVLVPGGDPCMMLVRNLGDIYVNSQTNNDAVCYVAFQA